MFCVTIRTGIRVKIDRKKYQGELKQKQHLINNKTKSDSIGKQTSNRFQWKTFTLILPHMRPGRVYTAIATRNTAHLHSLTCMKSTRMMIMRKNHSQQQLWKIKTYFPFFHVLARSLSLSFSSFCCILGIWAFLWISECISYCS